MLSSIMHKAYQEKLFMRLFSRSPMCTYSMCDLDTYRRTYVHTYRCTYVRTCRYTVRTYLRTCYPSNCTTNKLCHLLCLDVVILTAHEQSHCIATAPDSHTGSRKIGLQLSIVLGLQMQLRCSTTKAFRADTLNGITLLRNLQ